MESLEEVQRKYKLSEEEHNRIANLIMSIMLFDKYPVSNPKAIIDIAPPASGKTGLNGYGVEHFQDNNVVVINSDELKPFHPKIDEIARLYPQYYTKVTDQESNTWTSDLFDTALKNGYNVIFEGTGRNARILNTIKDKMQGYEVTVRGMAVNELNCLMSILERYAYQVATKGWGRLVTVDHFYETYKAMPDTIDVIEASKAVNSVEIYKRGSTPTSPVKIYDSIDETTGRFPNAKYAVLGGRLEDEKQAIKYYEENFAQIQTLISKDNVSEEELGMVNRIRQIYEDLKKKTVDRER